MQTIDVCKTQRQGGRGRAYGAGQIGQGATHQQTLSQRCVGQTWGRGRELLGPLDGPLTEAVNAVWQGVALASVAVPPSKHNGLNASIQLRQGYL